jgi:polygalacturonase
MVRTMAPPFVGSLAFGNAFGTTIPVVVQNGEAFADKNAKKISACGVHLQRAALCVKKHPFCFLSRQTFVACLLSFAAAGNIMAAETAPGNYFNVRNYGAVGDGTNLDSPAIDRAVAAAAACGGGTVLVPAGTYLSGSIHLRSNIHLVIDSGATILGAPQTMEAYDLTEPWTNNPYQDGGHCYFHNSLIWGENLTNVFITGNGTINGGGLVRSDGILDRMVGFNHPDRPVTNQAPPVRLGNKAIALKLCRNVLIRDLTIFHGGHFAILVTGCDNLTVDNVTMDTDRDGIDIDCCRNTMVSNCRINSPNDDGLCPKSTCALGELRPTENLTIINCQVSGFEEGTLIDGTMKPSKNHNGRIKFGTESSGGFRNCSVANCTFRSCRGLALEEVDGGIMDNITINNLTMMAVPDYAIYITTGKRNRTPNLAGISRGRNILISNVIADGVGKMSGIQIVGLPGQPVEGVRLENIRLTCNGGGTMADAAIVPKELGAGYPEPRKLGTLPAYGVFARHVKGLELANITVNFITNDLRPAASFADIQGLEIDNFKPRVAQGVKAALFADSAGRVTIRNSPALQDSVKEAVKRR